MVTKYLKIDLTCTLFIIQVIIHSNSPLRSSSQILFPLFVFSLSAANWLKPPDIEQKKRKTPRYLTRTYWHNNSRKLFFLCLYALLNVLLFIIAMLKNAHGGPWFMVAKGCGQCLNLNCTFVMVSWASGII